MRKKTTLKKIIVLVLFALTGAMGLSAQTNNSAPYCQGSFSLSPCNQPNASNDPSNTINNFIDNVLTAGATSNIINPNTGCNGLPNNYIYYCTPFLVGSLGQVITMSVQSGQLYPQSFAVFVDWNQNNNFEIPAEQLNGTLNPIPTNSFFVTTFTVPPTQQIGLYRLRIRCYVTSNAYVDPCNQALVGETEDYNFYVGNSGPPPLSSIVGYNAPLCSGQTLNFSLNHNGSGATVFNWSGPGGFTSYLQNPSIANITPSVAGTYSVNIIDGSCSVAKTVNVNLTLTPTISVNTATVCAGNQATLVASGATTYTWNSGQTTPTLYVTPVATTSFVVTGSTNSCTSTNTTIVTVMPTFTMDITSTSTMICSGSSVVLNATGANTYTWSTGATGNTIVVSPTATTVYSVTGDSGPCSSQAAFVQYVQDCSSINSISAANGIFKVYPNPFLNQINVQAPDNTKLQLFSSTGQLLITKQISNNEKLTTENLSPGIYFISLNNKGISQTLKIIKN